MNDRWLTFDALGNSFKDLVRHASTSFLCAAVLALPVLLSATISSAGAPVLGGLLTLFSMFFVAAWLPFAITLATKQYALGQDPGPGGLLDLSANRRLFSYLATLILFFLLLVAVALLLMLPLFGLGLLGFLSGMTGLPSAADPRPLGMGLIILIPAMFALFLVIYLRYGLATQVNALEGTSPTAAFLRSRKLLKGRKMDFFVMLLIVFAINAVISLVLSGPGMLVSITGSASRPPASGPGMFFSPLEMMRRQAPLSPGAALLTGISTYLSAVVSGVFMATAMTNYYLSARGEEVMQEARLVASDNSTPDPTTIVFPGETQGDPHQQ